MAAALTDHRWTIEEALRFQTPFTYDPFGFVPSPLEAGVDVPLNASARPLLQSSAQSAKTSLSFPETTPLLLPTSCYQILEHIDQQECFPYLFILYQNRYQNLCARLIGAYQLVSEPAGIYIDAYCYLRQDTRQFRLDRIYSVLPLITTGSFPLSLTARSRDPSPSVKTPIDRCTEVPTPPTFTSSATSAESQTTSQTSTSKEKFPANPSDLPNPSRNPSHKTAENPKRHFFDQFLAKRFKISEVAQLLEVCTKTIRRREETGKMKCDRIKGRHRRVTGAEILRLKVNHPPAKPYNDPTVELASLSQESPRRASSSAEEPDLPEEQPSTPPSEETDEEKDEDQTALLIWHLLLLCYPFPQSWEEICEGTGLMPNTILEALKRLKLYGLVKSVNKRGIKKGRMEELYTLVEHTLDYLPDPG